VSKPEQVGKAKGKQKRVTSTEKIYQNVADIQDSQRANSVALEQMAKRLDELTLLIARSTAATAVAAPSLSLPNNKKKRKADEMTSIEPQDEFVSL